MRKDVKIATLVIVGAVLLITAIAIAVKAFPKAEDAVVGNLPEITRPETLPSGFPKIGVNDRSYFPLRVRDGQTIVAPLWVGDQVGGYQLVRYGSVNGKVTDEDGKTTIKGAVLTISVHESTSNWKAELVLTKPRERFGTPVALIGPGSPETIVKVPAGTQVTFKVAAPDGVTPSGKVQFVVQTGYDGPIEVVQGEGGDGLPPIVSNDPGYIMSSFNNAWDLGTDGGYELQYVHQNTIGPGGATIEAVGGDGGGWEIQVLSPKGVELGVLTPENRELFVPSEVTLKVKGQPGAKLDDLKLQLKK